MNTTIHTLARHHLVLDSRVTSGPPAVIASVFHPKPKFRRSSSTDLKTSNYSKAKRRWSSGGHTHTHKDIYRTPPQESLSRHSSQESIPDSPTSTPTSWSEYTVRKSLSKFRTRKSAKRWSGKKATKTTSRNIQTVLDNVYEISRDDSASVSEKCVAVLYSWFYGWIIDVYYSTTDEGRDKSFAKWILASLLVTATSTLFTMAGAVALCYFNYLIWTLVNASIYFAITFFSIGICLLGVYAIISFEG